MAYRERCVGFSTFYVKKKKTGNKVVIERRLNKGVERGRREGQEEGRMTAGEWVG
jgi:hypothetical protein